MKFKGIYILFLIAIILGSCKSKKTVTKKVVTKKTVTKDIVTEETVVTEFKVVIPSTTQDYINMYKQIAMDEMRAHKVPASITIAQGILESSSGKSPLALRSNNHFGIKCHKGWNGKKTYHDDDEKGECFRVYNDPRESYKDHSQFLMTRSWYDGLFKLKEDDYVAWAKGLKAAGYATDKKYPDKLIYIVEKYDLDAYDIEVLGTKEKRKKKKNKDNKNAPPKHKVVKGDTLYSISRKYGISVSGLKLINKLDSNVISIGQILIVNP